MRNYSSKQSGFTLVELIVVIVILGILSATALPRFINVTSDANAAAINGLAGGLRSAVTVVQARHFANGGTGTSVTMADGTTVAVTAANGVPTSAAAGILAAMSSMDGFNPGTAASGVYTVNFDTPITNCSLTYSDGTTGTPGAVVVTDSGC